MDNCIVDTGKETVTSYIVQNFGREEINKEVYNTNCVIPVNASQSIIYVERGEYSSEVAGLEAIPNCYALMDLETVEYTGVGAVRRQPRIDLTGRGVIIGFLDTGLDYTSEVFKNADGSTRILGIWDQTLPVDTVPNGKLPDIAFYGTEFLRRDIDAALRTTNPLELVPVTDDIGHGTAMAGIAAGNIQEADGFSGMAPLAGIAMVKVRPARESLREYYQINEGVPAYQEDDLLLGIKYLLDLADRLYRPIVICLGMGSNFGDHNEGGYLGQYMAEIANNRGVAMVVSAGNEMGRGHHYLAPVLQPQNTKEVEINVSDKQKGMSLSMWSSPPVTFSIGVQSPGGEYSGDIPMNAEGQIEKNFIFEQTRLLIETRLLDPVSGEGETLFRFFNLAEGIWKLRITNNSTVPGDFHIWLPVHPFIDEETIFLNSNPNTTICEPANNANVITIATCNQVEDSLYIYSSRGYARNGGIKPDITAPGVQVLSAAPGNRYIERTGSSMAAAVSAGIVALLMEWGIIQGNDISMNTTVIKRYLQRGAKRKRIVYPNAEWGYGVIDLYGVLIALQSN